MNVCMRVCMCVYLFHMMLENKSSGDHFTTSNSMTNQSDIAVCFYAPRPLLPCRPQAQYEVHELPLFV